MVELFLCVQLGYRVKIRCTMFFFLLSMKSIGFDIENVPFMCDRGHLLAAVRFLQPNTQLVISVKFCLEHIIRNINNRFGLNKDNAAKMRIIMNRLQSASTYEKYMIEIADIMDLEEVMNYEIIIYIMKIHPRHWTVFGNRHDISDESWKGLYENYLLIMLRLYL